MKELREHLTEPNPALGRQIDQTVDGMAHWSGGGPEGTTCAGCRFFQGKKRTSGIGIGILQPGRCGKYRAMMRAALFTRRTPVHLIPPNTKSCKYWEATAQQRNAV